MVIVRKCPVCRKRFERKTEPVICCSKKCRGLLQRKCERPGKAELERLVEEMPVVKIARRYGVSDQAVRKWCKRLGVLTKPRGHWAKASAQKGGRRKSVKTIGNEDIQVKFAHVAHLIS